MYLCKKVLTVLMSGHLLPVDMKPIVMIVTVPVFQVELLHPVLLEITIYVIQPQNTGLKISGIPTTQCGKAIVMKVVTVVLTMEDHDLM